MTQRHATKTYRGRQACAGSGATNPQSNGWNFTCPVCGRGGFSLTNGATPKLTTHIHADDLARGTSTSKPAQAPTKTVTPITMTLEQHKAIKAFYADENGATYQAMMDTNPGEHYTRYARQNGWS